MSTGATQSTTTKVGKEVVALGNVELARKWCESCREILGWGITSESSKMKSAANKAADGLNSLAAFVRTNENLQVEHDKLVTQFKEIAWEFELLRSEHARYEVEKDKCSYLSDERKQVQARIDDIENRIKSKLTALKRIEDDVTLAVSKETEKRQKLDEELARLPNGKEILSAKEKYKTKLSDLKKKVEVYDKTYDTVTAKLYQNKVQEFQDRDWSKVASLNDVNKWLADLTKVSTELDEVSKAQADSKKYYIENQQIYADRLQQLEAICPPGQMTTLAANYSNAASWCKNLNWINAAECISVASMKQLADAINVFQAGFQRWTEEYKKAHATFKTKLDGLKINEYRLVGLSKFANDVATGNVQKNYPVALQNLKDALVPIEAIIVSDGVALSKRDQLSQEVSLLRQEVDKVTDEPAKSFAVGYRETLDQVLPSFIQKIVKAPFNNDEVPSQDEIEKVYQEFQADLATLRTKIDSLKDPEAVKNLKTGFAEKFDITPMVQSLRATIVDADSEISELLGYRFDVAGDAVKAGVWNSTLQGINDFIASLKGTLVFDSQDAYDAAAQKCTENQAKVDGVLVEVRADKSTTQNALNSLQQKLTQEIAELEKGLRSARKTTIRESMWVEKAKLELVDLKAVAEAGNKVSLDDAIARTLSLKDYCARVLEDSSILPFGSKESIKQYDALKEKAEELAKELRDPKLGKMFKSLVQVYGGTVGHVPDFIAQLRNDGPGILTGNVLIDRQRRLQELTTEVRRDILGPYEELKVRRKNFEDKSKEALKRIEVELSQKIADVSGKPVSSSNLALYDQWTKIQGEVALADNKEKFEVVEKRLKDLNEQIDWALEDLENGKHEDFTNQHNAAESIKRELDSTIAKSKAEYEMSLLAYREAKDVIKAKPAGVDKAEYERIVKLRKQALESFKNESFMDAAKKQVLATRLMQALSKNKQGSEVTSRGQEKLLELDAKWKKGLQTFSGTLDALKDAILTSCKNATDEFDEPQAAKVSNMYNDKVAQPLKEVFDHDAFTRGLIVLQGKAPTQEAERLKDLASKRKYRESMLAQIRNYESTIHGNPLSQKMIFESTPWRQDKVNVNGMDLLRALNDMKLNVERGVG